MEEKNLTLINIINERKINDEQIKIPVSAPEINENVNISIDSFLIEQLGIDENEVLDEKKQLIKKNFIHLMCQVINDLKIINERLKKYKAEKTDLEGNKSNEAEYRRRKLEYFTRLNKRAQNDIFMFMNNEITEYLLKTNYDTLQREINNVDCCEAFLKRRYLFAMLPEYYDVDYDYSTVVKISHVLNKELLDDPALKKRFLEMHRENPEKYYSEIKILINQKKVLESLKEYTNKNYHLYKRYEIFMDMARLYDEKHYQSFVVLGLIQLEGLFFDICSIRYDNKENTGSLVKKVHKTLREKNEISYMRYFPYFAFDVPIKRNEIAHTGLIRTHNIEQLANELLLDLNAVAQMAKMESDEKFRIFAMIYEALLNMDFSDKKAVNKKLIFELFASSNISPDSFWDVLKNPNQFKEEIEFYKQDDMPEGQVDLLTIVRTISNMVYQLPFWSEMVNTVNTYDKNHKINQFLLNMAQNYIKVLDKDCKSKCMEILTALN